jgi:3',5'-cyclic AMP phosphodiesterase CpdA
MLSTKPESIMDNNYINSLYEDIKADPNPRPILTIAHISDLHMDYSFTPSEDAPFGIVGKETSYSVLVALLTYIKDIAKPDILVWTGDNSKSDTWANTIEEVVDYTKNITETIKMLNVD